MTQQGGVTEDEARSKGGSERWRRLKKGGRVKRCVKRGMEAWKELFPHAEMDTRRKGDRG